MPGYYAVVSAAVAHRPDDYRFNKDIERDAVRELIYAARVIEVFLVLQQSLQRDEGYGCRLSVQFGHVLWLYVIRY